MIGKLVFAGVAILLTVSIAEARSLLATPERTRALLSLQGDDAQKSISTQRIRRMQVVTARGRLTTARAVVDGPVVSVIGVRQPAGATLVEYAGDRIDGRTATYFALAIHYPGARWRRFELGRLALVPVNDPTQSIAGGSVRIRVIFDGKPLSDATVVADGAWGAGSLAVHTDIQGEALIRVPRRGINVLSVNHRAVTRDHDGIVEDLTATLSFETKE